MDEGSKPSGSTLLIQSLHYYNHNEKLIDLFFYKKEKQHVTQIRNEATKIIGIKHKKAPNIPILRFFLIVLSVSLNFLPLFFISFIDFLKKK